LCKGFEGTSLFSRELNTKKVFNDCCLRFVRCGKQLRSEESCALSVLFILVVVAVFWFYRDSFVASTKPDMYHIKNSKKIEHQKPGEVPTSLFELSDQNPFFGSFVSSLPVNFCSFSEPQSANSSKGITQELLSTLKGWRAKQEKACDLLRYHVEHTACS